MSDPIMLPRMYGNIRAWKWLLWPIVLLSVAIGFDFKTPRAHFEQLERADSTLLAANRVIRIRQDSLEVSQRRIERYLRALSVAQCIDRPRRDWQLMGLPCEELLQRGSMP